MSMKKTMVMVAAILLLLSGSAFAQGAYFAAADAAQQQMQKFVDLINDMKHAEWNRQKADEARTQLVGDGKGGLMGEVRKASAELDAEITKLKVNPKENAAELKKLTEARKNMDVAKGQLTKLQSHMASDQKMKLALKNGTLAKFAADGNAAMTKSTDAIKAVNETTTNAAASGDDKPGTIEIQKMSVKSGKLRFFITEKTGSEKEVFEGTKVTISKFPVTMRVSIQDTEKVRLDGQWGSGNANWDEKSPLQHVYAYEGQSGGGRSTWTAREEYKVSASDHKELLRTIGQRNSDASTVKATGDIVEIVPAKAIAQGIGIDVEAKSLKWERVSKFTGSTAEKKADVVSKDNTASAHLVIAFFPAGT